MSTGLQEVARVRPAAAAPPPALGLRSQLQFTMWFACVAGLAESGILAVQRHLLHRVLYRSEHYLWMPTTGLLLLLAVAALAYWSLARFSARLRRPRPGVAMLLTLSTFSVLMVTRWLHPLAAFLLACGFAVTLTGRPGAITKLSTLSRKTLPVLATLVLLLACFSITRPLISERRAVAALPHARAGSPNILFLILDTVRGRSLSLYGYQRKTTPNLERLAHAGLIFDRAIAPAPWTLPSHASMFTGQLPQDLSADRFTPLDDRYRTVAEVLRSKGYATAGFAANLAYASYEFGLERGFTHWNDYEITLSQVLVNSSLGRFLLLEGYSGGRNSWLARVLGFDAWIGHTRNAANINDKLLDWVAKQKRPYFVFANYFDTHIPYLPPRPYLGAYGPVTHSSFLKRLRNDRPGKWPRRGNPQHEAVLRDRYEESITYLDSQIGSLVDALRRSGELENTFIVIASDHGEEFGENGAYEHDSGLSFNQIRVPLLVIGPHIPQNAVIEKPVSLRDLAATLVQLSGNSPSGLAGTSLVPLWSGTPNAITSAAYATLEKQKHSQAAIVTDRYHYIRRKDGEQLYDHVADPNETKDLAGDPAVAPTLANLRKTLDAQGASQIFRSTKR